LDGALLLKIKEFYENANDNNIELSTNIEILNIIAMLPPKLKTELFLFIF
jgi:hypothetical protein